MLKIGKIVGTHGIKGEIRIRSNFQHKERVFQPEFKLYFNDDPTPHIIKTYRHHKDYEMITFDDFKNINEVLLFMGNDVHINKEDLQLAKDSYLNEDLIGCSVYFLDNNCGKIIDFVYNNGNNLLMIKNEVIYYIPFNDNFIAKVDISKKRLDLVNVEGLIK